MFPIEIVPCNHHIHSQSLITCHDLCITLVIGRCICKNTHWKCVFTIVLAEVWTNNAHRNLLLLRHTRLWRDSDWLRVRQRDKENSREGKERERPGNRKIYKIGWIGENGFGPKKHSSSHPIETWQPWLISWVLDNGARRRKRECDNYLLVPSVHIWYFCAVAPTDSTMFDEWHTHAYGVHRIPTLHGLHGDDIFMEHLS